MAHDASQLLGAKQLAGTTVNPRGYGWKEGAARAGVAGATIGHAAARRASGGNWEFEVSPLIRQKVVQVVHAMGY